MDAPSGVEAARTLLHMLPPELLERVLAYLEPADAERVRELLGRERAFPGTNDHERALQTFFDMQHAPVQKLNAPPAAKPTQQPNPQRATTAAPIDDKDDATESLRKLDAAVLARALADEQPATIALILGRIELSTAAETMRLLPADLRPGVAVQLTLTSSPNPVLVERVSRAVLEKAQAIAAIPPEPTREDRTRNLAAMIRRLARADRAVALQAIEKTDPDALARIRQEMFRFDDLLKVEDRPLQALLAEIDMKTLAVALKGSPDAIAEKILRNVSSRNRQLLADEIAMLGNLQKARVLDAQAQIVELLRRHEEEGKINFEG